MRVFLRQVEAFEELLKQQGQEPQLEQIDSTTTDEEEEQEGNETRKVQRKEESVTAKASGSGVTVGSQQIEKSAAENQSFLSPKDSAAKSTPVVGSGRKRKFIETTSGINAASGSAVSLHPENSDLLQDKKPAPVSKFLNTKKKSKSASAVTCDTNCTKTPTTMTAGPYRDERQESEKNNLEEENKPPPVELVLQVNKQHLEERPENDNYNPDNEQPVAGDKNELKYDGDPLSFGAERNLKPSVPTASLHHRQGELHRKPASNHGQTKSVSKKIHASCQGSNNDPANGASDEESFAAALQVRGFEIREQEGDGNCLFRAVSLQIYGDPSMHGEVRKRCLDFMAKDEEHFSHFVENEPFQDYIKRKREDGVHGNNPEIQAISELYNRPVEVFTPQNGATPLNIFQSEYKTSDVPIRLSYHDGNHYNAVIDPVVPTAGLGLGMPGLQPGLADKMQMAKAVRESDQLADQMDLKKALKSSHAELKSAEDDLLQRAIKESALVADRMHSDRAVALSDLDATNFELEQKVLESSMDSYRQTESGRKQRASEKRQRTDKGTRGYETKNTSTSAVALPSSSSSLVASVAPSVASMPVAAAPAEESPNHQPPPSLMTADEYPQTIQELVMNGFALDKVVKAYDLIGDSFDDLLAFLMSTANEGVR